MSILNKDWERIQERAFTKWVNSHLKKRSMEVQDIATDFMDGVKLINLYEAISEESLGKYYPAPKLKFHQIANLNIVVREINGFVSSAGIKVQFSVEQIYEGDKRQILGMVWCLIHKFEIQDISEDELSAKEGLLLWCQKKTAGYNDVKIDNFHSSWVDGLAFCALIHHHRPDLLDFDTLSKANKKGNLELAFSVAEKELDIPGLLEPDDLTEVARPDEKVLMAYVAYYWKKFASSKKSQQAANVIGRNVIRQKELGQMENDYVTRAKEMLLWLEDMQEAFKNTTAEHFGHSLEDVNKVHSSFENYKNNQRSEKLVEKLNFEALLANLNSLQKNAGLVVYVPEDEISVDVVNDTWNELTDTQEEYEKALNERVRFMKHLEILLNRFNSRIENVQQWQENKIKSFAEEDPSKYNSISALQSRLKTLELFADEVANIEKTLDRSKEIGQEIIDAEHLAAEDVSEAISTIDDRQEEVMEAANTLQKKLEEVRDVLEDSVNKCLEFSRCAGTLNLLLHEAGLVLNEPVQASSVDDVEGYETVFNRIAEDLEANGSSLQELSDLHEEITSEGQDPSLYSSQSLEELYEKFNAIKSQHEEKNQELEEEREKQNTNATMLKQFAEDCADYSEWTDEKKYDVNDDLDGELEEQKATLQQLQEKLSNETDEKLNNLRAAYVKLEEAQVAEHAEMSVQALQVLNEQLKSLICKRIEAVESQIHAAVAGEVSEEQIEEFKRTFDHFDKDNSGELNKLEFKACLASLDEDISEDEFENTFAQMDDDGDGQISFEEFLVWISTRKREGSGYDDVLKAFMLVSGGNDTVTEAQLRSSGMAPDEIAFLVETMPQPEDGALDFRAYLAAQFGEE